MSKKNIIIISCIAALVIIAIVVTLILVLSDKKTVKIEEYNENSEVAKTIELNDKKTVKKLYKMANENTLNTENVPENLGIRNDVKISFNDGRFFMLQFNLEEYCYYENPNTDKKIIVNMPEGLLDTVNNLLEQN
ncbi:MAG: hypothetical protein J5507_02850 [Clostridia bacterium]|nr:hypothetical protein [Clostridia bacterium]